MGIGNVDIIHDYIHTGVYSFMSYQVRFLDERLMYFNKNKFILKGVEKYRYRPWYKNIENIIYICIKKKYLLAGLTNVMHCTTCYDAVLYFYTLGFFGELIKNYISMMMISVMGDIL